MNPDTMAQLGLADGDPVRLGNERGSLVLHAKGRPGQQETTIVVESIWPNRHWQEGIGINLLLSADPAPPNGGAVDPRHGGLAGAGDAGVGGGRLFDHVGLTWTHRGGRSRQGPPGAD